MNKIKIIKPTENQKPRIRFCWVCSRILRGNQHSLLDLGDTTPRVCHISCAKDYVEEHNNEKPGKQAIL